MNFLMQSAQSATSVSADPTSISSDRKFDVNYVPKPATTLEGLIAKDSFPLGLMGEDNEEDTGGTGVVDGRVLGSSTKTDAPIVENYIDVGEDEGWITIPQKELPGNWSEACDILSLRTLDRSFLFPGEQVHILVCLSAYKQDVEIITPFKVAAAMSKNGTKRNTKKQNGNIGVEVDSGPGSTIGSPESQEMDQNGENLFNEEIGQEKDVSSGESLLRMEDRKRKTQALLQRFENSHFFVRISESDVPLWSKRNSHEESRQPSYINDNSIADSIGTSNSVKRKGTLTAVIDKGNFDARASGGLARNAVKCCSLTNGDIVILLKVNVGVDFVRDPVLEILQFEKFQDKNMATETQENPVAAHQDPCGDLLKWLLPLNNSIPPPSRPLSPSTLSSNSSIRSTSNRTNSSASSGSQMFSFGHFRSYSMSSLPPSSAASAAAANVSSKPKIDLEDWKQISSSKYVESSKTGNEGMLSFRGVSLEPNRFSVQCGLEGIYIPGKRWRRKVEIVQPIEIHTFAADCNTDDLLCVQIKNVSPDHASDVVVYVDAITIVFEEVAKGGPPISLPVACVEAGDGHSLPDLALRRGEEHSFILKPAISRLKTTKVNGSKNYSQVGSNLSNSTNILEGDRNADQFAVLVSCRCNYTESKLFFKQPTSWRPRVSREMMISVASEMSRQNLSSNGSVTHLPVQVLTLQASNLTSEDLTLTVLAPASVTSPPSVLPLNFSPSTPMSPFIGHFNTSVSSFGEKRGSTTVASENQKQNGDGGGDEKTVPISNILPTTDLGCTHLWLQSRVPLGCIPSQSTTTIKLELLPLTDGIITLDSLQIDVKEKGMTYIPEHSLKINATSSIASGII